MRLYKVDKAALAWLRNRGGEGQFDDAGVLHAKGCVANVTRKVWQRLVSAGLLDRREARQLVVTAAGRALDLAGVDEAR